MPSILTGSFPNASGSLTRHDRMPVEVLRDGQVLHFRLAGSGFGSVAMAGGTGRGSFHALSGDDFVFLLEPDGSGTRYRILRGGLAIATGMLYDLPP